MKIELTKREMDTLVLACKLSIIHCDEHKLPNTELEYCTLAEKIQKIVIK